MSEGGQWLWQDSHETHNVSSATATATAVIQQSGQGVNQVEGMCLGGGIYSLGSPEVIDKKKMPQVKKWTSFAPAGPAAPHQRAHVCDRSVIHKDLNKGKEETGGICLGHVNIIGDRNSHKEEFEVIEVNIDSGAIDSCIPPNVAEQFKVRSTKMSENGGYYTSASGGAIYNEGERDVHGVTDDSQEVGMTFQVAKVRGPLGSVRRICEAGNRVVFDDEGDGSYIESKRTGKKTKIDKVKGVYLLRLWVNKERQMNSIGEDVKQYANSNSVFARLGQMI
jgi:hypothetical protein